MFAGSLDSMKQFMSRAVGWVPMILVIIGSLAMIAGLFSIRTMADSPTDAPVPPHAAVYVGGGTCYTCHTGDFDGWSVPVDLQAMADAAAKPKQVVANVRPRGEVEQVEIGPADLCTTGSDAAQISGSTSRHYIVRTDVGETLLALDWDEQKPGSPEPNDQSAETTDCILNLPGGNASGIQLTSRDAAPHFHRPYTAQFVENRPRRAFTRFIRFSETAFMEGQSA